MKIRLLLSVFLAIIPHCACGMLKPRESESRSIQEMNGMWTFRADMSSNRNEGMDQKWWESPLSKVSLLISLRRNFTLLNEFRQLIKHILQIR